LGLLSGLISQGIEVDFIGNDEMSSASILKNKGVNFYNLRGDQNPNAPMKEKILRILKYYYRLIEYTIKSDSELFHIQWLNKFIYFDRTFLNIFYKLLGKKLVFTAHNINAGERDGNDTTGNRLTLKLMYKIVDHIIVHTDKMKLQLMEEFNIENSKISVIPHGIINIVPKTELTRVRAREKLNLGRDDKVILFFGIITPYKGLDYLIKAMVQLKNKNIRLIIAGKIDATADGYWENIQRIIKETDTADYIIGKIGYIPDAEIEVYFKAADVLILPYLHIFQSGVPFLAYNFGLPVIATDVGSLKDDIIDYQIGFICQKENPQDLADKIDLYFNSDLYKNLEVNRDKIITYANEKYSWEKIGEKPWRFIRGYSRSLSDLSG